MIISACCVRSILMVGASTSSTDSFCAARRVTSRSRRAGRSEVLQCLWPNEYHKRPTQRRGASARPDTERAPSACFARKTLLCRWRTASRFCLGRRLRRCALWRSRIIGGLGALQRRIGVARSFYDKARIMFADSASIRNRVHRSSGEPEGQVSILYMRLAR